jgi:hypothetical protein
MQREVDGAAVHQLHRTVPRSIALFVAMDQRSRHYLVSGETDRPLFGQIAGMQAAIDLERLHEIAGFVSGVRHHA